ncbi:hypothetical protein BC941DRAFT_475669 [Chlamydoabsidia padenii]|nr:hypothetical protein BC941DRAFT_475669 [Chlamydoabsidia padenii]
MNSVYTDGHTCRVLFARKVVINPLDAVELTLDDFTEEEVDQTFRMCTVDPGSKDAFVSYHGGNQVRKLTTAEYYHMSGALNRMKKEDARKIKHCIKQLETNVPTVVYGIGTIQVYT